MLSGMSKRTVRHDEEVRPFKQAIETAFRANDLALLVLRCHMVVETLLYRVLAARLDVAVGELPNLPFSTLLQVTLVGERHEEVRPMLDRLNFIRNRVAHDLDDSTLATQVGNLVADFADPRVSRLLKENAITELDGLKSLTLRLAGALHKEVISQARTQFEYARGIILAMNMSLLGFDVEALKDDLIDIRPDGRLVGDMDSYRKQGWRWFPWGEKREGVDTASEGSSDGSDDSPTIAEPAHE